MTLNPYALAVAGRNALYDRGVLKSRRLRAPVVSVGNISVGGTGKTPFVVLLGQLLKARGIAFDVLTRGYRRESTQIAVVDPQGSPRQFGDEPLLLADHLRVPVIVGGDRYRAGRFAEQRFGPRLHLLDDGFQHRQLERDFDIVLVTPEDESDNILPAGRLREPRTTVARADVVVLMRGARPEAFPAARCYWRVERTIEVPELPERPLAFCGIGKPHVLFEQLRARGIRLGAQIAFRDHHAYSARDVERLRDIARQRGTNGYVTTEKDAINLGALANRLTPLSVVETMLRLDDADSALDSLLRSVRSRRPEFTL